MGDVMWMKCSSDNGDEDSIIHVSDSSKCTRGGDLL